MSYYMICPKCGKGTIGRYATDNSLCGECSDNSSTTDELSVEKLQEIRVEELKDFNSKILQAELKNQKLQEQLNTAKYFFKNILDVNPNLHRGNSVMHLKNCVRVMKISAEKALAAIGGDDGQ
ncbi:hypothetical protein V425_10940 [Lactococcus lactis RTB018]|nr:hypothetical protein [Lactococcus lactis]OAZ15912.1 hypothetical protein V425_10940 [Lactococcus lactis RTB018]